MRKNEIKDSDLPGEDLNDNIVIKTKEKKVIDNDDEKPDRLELSLTRKQKRDLISNAKERYGLKPSACIKMILKEKGII